MNKIANEGMHEFWNGTGALKWLRFQDRMEKNLTPYGHEVMSAAMISTGDFVLDIGCGCGDTSFQMARRVKDNGHVYGVDISVPFVTEATKRKALASAQNTTFLCGDAQVYPFETAVFDVVFSRFGGMFFDDPVQAYGNVRRGMKNNGRLAFICWRPAKDNEWISLSLDVVANHISLPEPLGPEDPGPMSFGDENRVLQILTKAGFSNIQIEASNTPFTVGTNVDEAVEFLTQLGPAGGAIFQSGTDEASKTHIAADLRKALEPFLTERGVVLGAATWIVTATNSGI